MATADKKKTFRLHSLQEDARIILHTKSGFDKEATLYNRMEEDIEKEWNERRVNEGAGDNPKKRKKFKIGQFVIVMVHSNKGSSRNVFRRGVITDEGLKMSTGFMYQTFLYDHGCYEDVVERNMFVMSDTRRSELCPRTEIVHLLGVAPAKLVIDHAKSTLRNEAPYILTQDTAWSKKTIKMMKSWLQPDNLRYLELHTVKRFNGIASFGDVFRRLSKKVEDKSQKDRQAEKPKTVNIESLIKWLVEQKLALANAGLQESQLKGPQQQDKAEAERALSERKNKVSVLEKPQTVPECSSSSNGNIKTGQDKETVRKPSIMKAKPGEFEDNMDYGINSVVTVSDSTKYIKMSNKSIDYNYSRPGHILIRGAAATKPLNHLRDAFLPQSIFQALRTIGITDLSRLQKLVFANFYRGNDVIMVAPNTSSPEDHFGANARLLGYILPILKVVYKKYDNMVQKDKSHSVPEVIIIVNSNNTGTFLENRITELLGYCPNLNLRIKFVGKNDSTDNTYGRKGYEKIILPNGISVMIITVEYMSAILTTHKGADLCNNLEYIVFEELELYMNERWGDIVNFVDTLRLNAKCTERNPFQLAFSASKWFLEMEKLYFILASSETSQPAIIISGVNDVLRYANIQWTVHHMVEEIPDLDNAKMEKIKEILNSDGLEFCRTIIACSVQTVATFVHDWLTNQSGLSNELMVLTSNIPDFHLNLKEAEGTWNQFQDCILVISDDILTELNVHNATRLICFDSPLVQQVGGRRRQVAAERFGVLWENIRHIGNNETRKPIVAHFLMTGEEHNFYHMYRFATSLCTNVNIPDSLHTKALQMGTVGEHNVRMCEGIEQFGFCTKKNQVLCSFRHDFTQKDLSAIPSAPTFGEIEVLIRTCKTPSKFKVQLLNHFLIKDGKRIKQHSYVKELDRRHEVLEEYAAANPTKNEEGKLPDFWKQCGWYAVLHPELKKYSRAKLMTISGKDNPESLQPTTARFFFVDIGDYSNPAGNELQMVLSLPKEFQDWNPLVVTMILSNLKPNRTEELEYRDDIRRKSRRMFLQVENKFLAKVWIALGDKVWVNPLVEVGSSVLQQANDPNSIRLKFTRNRMAVNNSTHLQKLATLLRDHGDLYRDQTMLLELEAFVTNFTLGTVPNYLEVMSQFFQLGDNYRWAFINKPTDDDLGTAKILATFGHHPYLFYGVHEKFQQQVKRLEKDLHKEIEEFIDTTKNPNIDGKEMFITYKDSFNDFYQLNLVVAAKEEVENTWMRAIIVDIVDDESNNGNKLFQVFFVDYGDDACLPTDRLFPIPKKFVHQMPFQAISFKMDHIQPIGDFEDVVWDKDAKDMFLDTIMPNELSAELAVVVTEDIFTEGSGPNHIPCNFYTVIPFCNEKDIGNLMVTKGKAAWKLGRENAGELVRDNLFKLYNETSDICVKLEDSEDEEKTENNSNDLEICFEKDWFDLVMPNQLIDIMDSRLQYSTDVHDGKMINLGISPQQSPLSSENSVKPMTSSSKNQQHTHLSSSSVIKPNRDVDEGKQLLHPNVLWHQTSEFLILTIQLPDIKKYDFTVSKHKIVSFRTSDRPNNYGFTLELFGRVSQEVQENLTGQSLRVRLKKKMQGAVWARILLDKMEKYKWLKVDFDYTVVSDEEDGAENPSTGFCSSRALGSATAEQQSDSEENNLSNIQELEVRDVEGALFEDNENSEDDFVHLGDGGYLS